MERFALRSTVTLALAVGWGEQPRGSGRRNEVERLWRWTLRVAESREVNCGEGSAGGRFEVGEVGNAKSLCGSLHRFATSGNEAAKQSTASQPCDSRLPGFRR